jgi:hypothetical protein
MKLVPWLAAALVLGGAAFAISQQAACTDAQAHLYSARFFDSAGQCLEPYQAIDVIDGPGGAATCAPICLANKTETFVSQGCPPFPFGYDTSAELQETPACKTALALLACDLTCGSDAGCALPGGDAGSDAPVEAANDAPSSGDAGSDASGD